MSENKTLQYYNQNTEAFSMATLGVDFSDVQQAFLKVLPRKAHMLDFGCGSGRDSKYFLEHGYQVTAVDGSEKMCLLASDLIGQPVRQMLFHELNDKNAYDGIWACASILHLTKDELQEVLNKMVQALKANGVIYTSFKYGTFEGERKGRYFTDFEEESFMAFIERIKELQIEKMWVTGDVREGRGDERWLNLLLRRADIS